MININFDQEALRILERLGNVIYALGGIVFLLLLVPSFTNNGDGVVYFIMGLIAYALGWAIKYILSGKTGSVLWTLSTKLIYFLDANLRKHKRN